MNNKLVFILCLILALSYYLIFQEHILEDSVFHYSSQAGKLDSPFSYEYAKTLKSPFSISNDYNMKVNYKSTGAFMAGREISVTVDFWAEKNITRFRNSQQIVVVFPGALRESIANDQYLQNDASIELKFINDSNHALGKGNIIYYMPEYYNELISWTEGNKSHILPAISNDSRYTYVLIIDGVPQKPENTIIKNRFLSIAPLETYLQLKINNWIIFLTLIASVFTLIQLICKDEK